MKKAALVLAFVLFVCTLVPALAASPADILGVWYLKSVEYNSSEAVIEGDYRVEFNRDRSALLVLNGEEEKTTWEPEDARAVMKLGDSSTSFDLQEDGTLKASLPIYSEYYANCIFTREKEEQVQVPAAVDAASEDEYFGTYVITLQKDKNILLPIENGDTVLKAVIEFAQVTLSGNMFYEKSIMSDYQEGKVVIPAYSIVSDATEESKLLIGKTETGIVITCDAVPDTEYYLSPVEAAEEATGE